MLESGSPSKPFLGVSFVLAGFDPDALRKIRAKLVSGGGVDAGQYGPNCTHVIVGRIVFDDPVCVAARNDGKVAVTGLWVDHSYDIGMLVDTASIMYRPVKDLNGIAGAKSMVMCLTGYQRQDREDIMMMVSFMGAQFSKPLVANKVTHLICYKFEGEKYELAKKIKKIKLVNHRWLEDCLRDWEILPEANYSKSTYELEMMEAEAKDSEEDADNKFVLQPRENVIKRSPCTSKVGITSSLLPISAGESSKTLNVSGAVQHPSDVLGEELKSTPVKETMESSGINDINTEKMVGGLNMGISRALASTILNEASERTSSPPNLQKELLASKSSESSHLHSKSNSLSYSRKGPRRTSLGLQGRIELEKENPSRKDTDIIDGSICNSSIRVQQVQDLSTSDGAQVPSIVNDVPVGSSKSKSPQKRKLEASSAHSKSPKINLHIDLSTSGTPVTSNAIQGSKASAFTGQPAFAYDLPLGHQEICPNKKVDQDAMILLSSASKCPSSGERQRQPELPETAACSETNMDKGAVPGLGTMPILGKDGILVPVIDEVTDGRHKQQAHDASSSKRLVKDIAKSPKQGDSDMLESTNDKVDENKSRKETGVKKKTLGSRPKLCNSANLKGSIYLTKDASINKPMSSTVGREEMNVPDHSSNMNSDKACLPPGNFEALDGARGSNVAQCQDRDQDTSVYMDDETEAPDEDDNVPGKRNDGEEPENVVLALPVEADKKGESTRDAANISSCNALDDVKEAGDGSKLEQGPPESKNGNVRGKSRGTKPSLASKKQKICSTQKEKVNCNGSEMEEQKRPKSKGKTKGVSKSDVSPDADKENKAAANADHGVSRGKFQARKSDLKSKKAMKINDVAAEMDAKSRKVVDRRIELACFILSGHSPRARRKEFQQVIRRLKGRFCRDSHQWSYQATHFIVPDPIRRTEKFFAAAASGRWILKTDYLEASSQAGKFLEEEPYEWHRSGLSEDGTISLEAPRKWRLLRERTGHGAFYDMQVLIYGECIAPSLDTLKRVIKAGDGTILATSPPYNRFFTKRVDFAIVSPGMPRVDIWVQEFLRHEIPCVVADYLVDYVCKPGYPLDKHVLYSTQAWAEKSFARLQVKAEEIEAVGFPDDDDDDGGDDSLKCEICGSADRGDVMLICGDESGSVGCGAGIHIDCCDPPLEAVPEEDWFCPSCIKIGNGSSRGSGTKRKRGGSVLRRKAV